MRHYPDLFPSKHPRRGVQSQPAEVHAAAAANGTEGGQTTVVRPDEPQQGL